MTDAVEIRVEKRFRHPARRVFDAFLDPGRVGQWLFHTPDGVMEQTDYDPTVGGGFTIAERRGDGLAHHFGRFVQIDRPHRIVFDFWTEEDEATPTRVSVTFTADGDHCVLVLTHDLAPAWAAHADRTTAGWTLILDNLATVMETA